MDEGPNHYLNMYWYAMPQFARRGLRVECVVHNRHQATAWTCRAAERRARAQCTPACMGWSIDHAAD